MQKVPAKLMYLLLKNRHFVIRVMLFVMIPAIVGSYFLPKKYTVTTVILPPENQSSGGLSLGGLSLTEIAGVFSGGMGYSLPLMTTLGDVYVTILNSRSLLDHVILKTGYMDTFRLPSNHRRQPQTALYFARRHFRKNYSASATSAGFIEIEVTTGSPQYSIQVSEEVVAALDSINLWVVSSRNTEDRLLLENQIASASSTLAATGSQLIEFENTYGFIEPTAALEQLIAVLSEMKAQYIEAVITAHALRSNLRTGTTASLLELEAKARELQSAIAEIEAGNTAGVVGDIGVRYDLLPMALIEYARLKTDYEIQLKLVSMLSVSLQQLRAQEASLPSSIRILDSPEDPGWKSKPKKLLIWIEVFAATLFLLCCYLLARERWHELRTEKPETWNRWNDILNDVRADFRRKKTR